MSDVSVPSISTTNYNEDPVYLLFRKWYFTCINRFFLHNQSSNHFNFYNNLFTYLIIVIYGLGGLINGLNLVFELLEMTEIVISLLVISLFVSFLGFVLGNISKTRDFGEKAEKHNLSGDQFLRIAEDIIRLFTPLSKAEAELNIASERTFIQHKMEFYTKIAPSIPSSVIKDFNKNKNNSKSYLSYIKLFNSINSESNYLFTNTHEQIMNDLGVIDEEHSIPDLQQMFNNLRGT